MTETFSVREQISLTPSEMYSIRKRTKRGEKSMTLRDSIFPLIFSFSYRLVTMINEAGGENVFPRRYFSFRRVSIAFKKLAFSSFVALPSPFGSAFLVYCKRMEIIVPLALLLPPDLPHRRLTFSCRAILPPHVKSSVKDHSIKCHESLFIYKPRIWCYSRTC